MACSSLITPKRRKISLIHVFWPNLHIILHIFYPSNTTFTRPLVAQLQLWHLWCCLGMISLFRYFVLCSLTDNVSINKKGWWLLDSVNISGVTVAKCRPDKCSWPTLPKSIWLPKNAYFFVINLQSPYFQYWKKIGFN